MGFDYEIQYKKGSENKAVDALSKLSGADLLTLVVSSICTDMMDIIKRSYTGDIDYASIIRQVEEGIRPSKFQFIEG